MEKKYTEPFFEPDEDILVFPTPVMINHDREYECNIRSVDELVNIDKVDPSVAAAEDLTLTSAHYYRQLMRNIQIKNQSLKENDRIKIQLGTDGGDVVPKIFSAVRDDVLISLIDSNTAKLQWGDEENPTALAIVPYRGIVNVYLNGKTEELTKMYDELIQRAYTGPEEFLKLLKTRDDRLNENIKTFFTTNNIRPILKLFIDDYNYIIDEIEGTKDFNIIESLLLLTQKHLSFIMNQLYECDANMLNLWFRKEEYEDFLSKWEKVEIKVKYEDIKNATIKYLSY